jgi:leucyl-tRNA synthetase
MSTPYKPEIVEQEAQQHWEEARSFEVDEDPGKEKFYCYGPRSGVHNI